MTKAEKSPRRWLMFVPLAIFVGLVLLFLFRLFAGDPSKLPSALIGKPAPLLTLAAVEGLTQDGRSIPGFGPAELQSGRPVLVNVFASWCAPCHQEHPFLMELAKGGRLTILGLNYKDKPENARRFLGRLGNPYVAVGVDPDGRNAIEWGVYGVPETFLVDGKGIIVFKHVGPLTPEIIRERLEPAIRAAGG
ncbi:MAG: DsbE family thiol:disulfide interchange protein [Rhizobiales bacterium]|nr:DsbE family thiol:disulfide interchange protein [Hyphomicrobiales bacterium]